MKTKKLDSKLALGKETIAVLNSETLDDVKGGTYPHVTNKMCDTANGADCTDPIFCEITYFTC